MLSSDSDQALIEKRILHPGRKNVDFPDGTKVHFHFQTRLCDADRTLLDDSRKMGPGKPFELILGKKFKLEVWEAILQKMALGEVASFTVDKILVMQYPFVAKTLRDVHKPKEERKGHHCAMAIQTEGLGYSDLDSLMKNPGNLEFIMELVEVDLPDSYEKDVWQLTEDEKLKKVPELKELGNLEFKQKNYDTAADHYAKAIGMIEQLMIKEKPHDVEWNELDKTKVPLLLNFAQCKLNKGDYYAVIEHCTTAIKTDPDNVKAYFRRAKAHVGAWNPREATADFEKVIELDSTLTAVVKKELTVLNDLMKKKSEEDKDKLKNMFN